LRQGEGPASTRDDSRLAARTAGQGRGTEPRSTRGQGKIINIASVQSELARPGVAPYTATKGAVKNLTRGMCADWAKYGLQINAIAPDYFKTPLNQALVDNPAFFELARKADTGGPLGQCRGVGRGCGVPVRQGFVLCQRPYAVCRWRDHHQSLGLHRFKSSLSCVR
jgi:NAD(P)-dependent dehydrogenase (short-subunit alcohol dehydrogenase family)